ncbi:MAG: hypothetical protein OQK25_07470, partial [Gammaproteobacteria bacterium]|nr:hypothetical protein [Gammaproteobacteria bacterium]
MMTEKKNKSADKEQNRVNPETASIKKSTPRKKATTKKAAPQKRTAVKKSAVAAGNDSAAIGELNVELRKMGQQNLQRAEAQEAKLSELMQGLGKTFDQIHKSSREQTEKLGGLMGGLEKAFSSIHKGTQNRDNSNSASLDTLSQTIIRSSDALRKEYEEMERLQEQKLLAEKEHHQYSFKIMKVIAVPAIVLALLGIGYMFYTVTVMERAMTAMSSDMHSMRISMGDMTSSVGGMNGNVEKMSGEMSAMRTSTGEISS